MSFLHSTRTRRGFTLVELLVVIAIIGILVGMLLPAVQAVREAARRATCLNNMRQMVLACHNYQSANQRYPAGATVEPVAGGGFDEFGASWNLSILGFIEESAALDVYKSTVYPTMQDGLIDLSSRRIDMFLCASATQEDELTTDGTLGNYTTHYYGCGGTNLAGYPFTPLTDDFPVGLSGVFSPRSRVPSDPTSNPAYYSYAKATTFADIRDGSSNTIAIGEASKSPNNNVGWNANRPGWAFGQQCDETTGDLLIAFSTNTTQYKVNALPPAADFLYTNHPMGSNHPGGGNVALADGSSKFISDAVDILVLAAASGMKDGALAELE